MNFILEEIKKKSQDQRGRGLGAPRNPGQQRPPPQGPRPPYQNQGFPNSPMGTPNQNFRSPNQPHQPNQTPPQRNPTPQYQQPNPQTNLNYNPKFTRNQSPNTPNIPNITNPQSFRTNFQQIPKQDRNINGNRNFQHNQNVNLNIRGSSPMMNDGYNQNYQGNSNNFGNRYNPNYMTSVQQGQPNLQRSRSPPQNSPPMGRSYSPPQHRQQYTPTQNNFPKPERPPQYSQQYQSKPPVPLHIYDPKTNQAQTVYETRQRTPTPPYQQRQQYQQPRQDQYQQNTRQQSPNRQYQPRQQQYRQRNDQNEVQQSYESRQRGNFRGRGFRGRGGFRGNRRDDIVDNKTMSPEQAQQRTKKFIQHNQPIKPRPSTKVAQKKEPKPRKSAQKDSISEPEYQSQENEQNMSQEMEDDEGSQKIQEADEQYQKQEDQQQQYSEKSYHSEYEQSQHEVEGSEEYDGDEDYSAEKYSQPSKLQIIPKRLRNQPEGSKQSMKMCSQKQFKNRMKIFMENNNDKIQSDGSVLKVVNNNLNLDTSKSFSIFELNKKTYLPDAELTLKKFQRSANRADDDDDTAQNQAVYIPRSKVGLVKTMQHIKTQILDADTKGADQLKFPIPPGQKRLQFIQIYVFLWDRMREMIKDITRLSEQSKHDRQVIQTCEQITRFFILSIHEGRKKYKNSLDFDDKMNKESIVKIMTLLLNIYTDSKLKLNQLIKRMEAQAQQTQSQITIEQVMQRMEQEGIYISPNQPEITSYAILFSVDYRKYLYENIFVGLQLQDYNPLYQSKQIQQVLTIKSALSMKNYSKYFDMIESEEFQYLLSCLMILNIQQIRREMSFNMFRSFKYLQGAAVKKGVSTNYLKNSLRFQNQQDYQFKKFLITINGRIKNDYVIEDELMPESEEIYKTPAYPIDFKMKRKFFMQLDDRSEKNMKRSDLVSRSWKKSTYVEELISCFLHRDYTPSLNLPAIRQKRQISPLRKSQRIQERNNVISGPEKTQVQSDQALIPNKPSKLNEVIATFRKKKNRHDFLAKVVLKLKDLFRPDVSKQQKKLKATRDLFNFFIKQVEYSLSYGLQAFFSAAAQKIQKQLILVRMHQLHELKKSFHDGFKPLKNGQDLKFSPFGLSNLLQRGKSEQSTYMFGKKEGFNLRVLLQKSKIKQFCIKIFIDTAPQEQHHNLIQRVLKNLIVLFFGKIELITLGIAERNYAYVHKDISIQIQIQTVSQPNPSPQPDIKTLLGADTIIYLQTKKSVKEFSTLLSKYFSIQNSIKKSPKLTLPIAVIRLLDSSKSMQYDRLTFQPQFECEDFMRTSAVQISATLNLGLVGFMNVSVGKYRLRPKICVKSMQYIFGLMSDRLDQLKNIITPQLTNQSIFIYYQQYFNLCIEKLIKLSKMYYLSPGIFVNWLTVIKQVYNQDIHPDKIQKTMSKQYKQLDTLLLSLKLISPYQSDQDKIIFGKNDFVKHYTEFIKRVDRDNVVTQEQIVKLVQILKIADNNNLLGNIQEFYQELFKILGKLFVLFNIVCAENFRFFIAKEQLYKEVGTIFTKLQQKLKKQQQKIWQMQGQNNRGFIPGRTFNNLQNNNNQNRSLTVSGRPQPQSQPQPQPQSQITTNNISNIIPNSNSIPNLNLNINPPTRPRPKPQFKYCRAQWLEDVKKKIKLQ